MVEDPFQHLHVEDYAQRYELQRVTSEHMLFMAGRQRISLSGRWQFVSDLFDEGLRQRWYRNPEAEPIDFVLPHDHDWGDWQRVDVPSCWNLQSPEFMYFEGSCWYSRYFDMPEECAESLIFLRIGAANYCCRVFLNGQCMGVHYGGSTPFFIDLTDSLMTQNNVLRIQVENRRQADRVPMHHIDWFNYGGLYREVDLVPVPAVFIRDFRISLAANGQLQAQIKLSEPVTASAYLLIDELDIRREITINSGRADTQFDAPIERWSPDNPKRYAIRLVCGDDSVEDMVGFRTISTNGTQLLLNDQLLWLKGVCCHEDDVQLGKCSNDEDIRQRLQDAIDLGANALRLTHYPHHERVAELADEMGLMLLEEIPVYWAIDFNNPNTREDATNQLREMIQRDYNRASVIMWGVGNENADSDARYDFMTSLIETARTEDSSRLITAACLINREQFRIEDRLADRLDVIGLNEYFGWYERGFDALHRLYANSNPDKPVLIAETGADAAPELPDQHTGQLFTESHQAEVLRQQINMAMDVCYVAGIFPWLLYDYRTERRQTSVQRGWSRKGLIEKDKATKKLGFEAVKALYRT